MKKDYNEDNLSQFWLVVSNIFPPVGFFLYLKHRRVYPQKAKKALVCAAIGVPIAMAAGYIMNTYILN